MKLKQNIGYYNQNLLYKICFMNIPLYTKNTIRKQKKDLNLFYLFYIIFYFRLYFALPTPIINQYKISPHKISDKML